MTYNFVDYTGIAFMPSPLRNLRDVAAQTSIVLKVSFEIRDEVVHISLDDMDGNVVRHCI